MIAKGTGFVKGKKQVAGKKLAYHLKYLQYRPRGSEETREQRFFFNAAEDHVDRKMIQEEIMAHTSRAVSYHRFVLSPSQEEPILDWMEWTRAVMRDLEHYKGQALHWYAIHHTNTDDPHIHIVLAGSGEDRQTGQPGPVKMLTKDKSPNGHDDWEFLRARGREHSEYEHYQYLQETLKELDREDMLPQQLHRSLTVQQHEQNSIHKGLER
ncbi:relaxase/mobilization nuclease domain-containing protein [Dictyobacter kobayashii]|uniref:MobA/VirD2-like nuclease domain-containing protein n=1 Tax=Dictyobacter kobayashii TaxID=2014872 RepID=A0A402APH1_9CHLR|nr:hypothetical protein [Dictyobacter kobayashii]GCE20925.1 hypothetical protein KDK_47250 [Dictyobacter kobayashii]